MRCYQIKPILQCYLDGELSLGEPEMVAEHLSRCVSCRNELYELKRASILLRRVASRPVSPGFSRGVIRGAQEIQQTGILQEKRAGQTISELPPFRMSHAALLAASLTLVALGGWWLGRSPDVLPPKPREYAEHPGVIRELAKQQVKRQMAQQLSGRPDLETVLRLGLLDLAARAGDEHAFRREIPILSKRIAWDLPSERPVRHAWLRRVRDALDPPAHAGKTPRAETVFEQGLRLMDQGQLEKAAKTLETARWRAGEALRGKILLQEASCRILLRRHSEFKRVYELLTQVIDKHPSLAQEAKALQRRSDDVEKRLLMVRTMSKRASTPTAYRDVGDMFLRIDDHRRAFNHYRKAIKGQLNATERARLMLAGAWCLKAQGEYARAQTLYEDLATRATGELQSMARAGAGNCALLRGQPKLAIAHYQALLVDVEKQTVDPYSRDLARCHLALGYRYSGDPAAKSALEQLSHSSSPLAHLGVKLLDKKSND